ncbi:hypothetical protein Q8F55_006604 [Vanrija albida]|uniref:Uncharacterized protein n=1 Tax=Vanrija albida TaxID=181172 RepID=A0ABR3PXN7_9TREE
MGSVASVLSPTSSPSQPDTQALLREIASVDRSGSGDQRALLEAVLAAQQRLLAAQERAIRLQYLAIEMQAYTIAAMGLMGLGMALAARKQ